MTQHSHTKLTRTEYRHEHTTTHDENPDETRRGKHAARRGGDSGAVVPLSAARGHRSTAATLPSAAAPLSSARLGDINTGRGLLGQGFVVANE